jgi:hypothetical protein
MGFNFGAFLGGAADQIVKDIDEQEKEVKLRTRTILDRQIAETAANRKEYKANKKKVTEQLNALVPLFGDDKNALAKARSIVAGGDTHFNNMFNILQNHSNRGGDANTIVKFAPDANITGFKNVEEATNSLVQMASIPAPTFGKQDDTPSAFGLDIGTSMYRGFYDKARRQYEEAGLLDPAKTTGDSAIVYATAQVDLSGVKKETKSLETQKAEVVNQMRDYLKGGGTRDDEEYKNFLKERDFLDENILSSNAALKVAEEKAKTDSILTVGQHQKILSEGLDEIENNYKDKFFLVDKLDKKQSISEQKQKDIYNYKYNYVKGLIVNGMDSNAASLIQNDNVLFKIYSKIQDEQKANIKKLDAFKVEIANAKNSGSPDAYINSLPEAQRNPTALKPILQQAFPDADIDSILAKLK